MDRRAPHTTDHGRANSPAPPPPPVDPASTTDLPADVSASIGGGLNFLAGLWLVLSPWALNYSHADDAVGNAVIVGAAVAVLALARAISPLQLKALGWVNLVLGIWLIVSPWVIRPEELGDTTPLIWNNVAVGIIVAALGASGALVTRASTRGRHSAAEPRR